MSHEVNYGIKDKRFRSGACSGSTHGADLTYGISETTLCERIMQDEDNLSAWLAARKKISLPPDSAKNMFLFMTIVEMCPLDDDFDEVLERFSRLQGDDSLAGEKDAWYDSEWVLFIMEIGKWIKQNFSLISSLGIIPVILKALADKFPKLEVLRSLSQNLEKSGKKIQR